MKLSPADALAEIGASSPGPGVGAFFDVDGTLVDGFTATAHIGDRIRRRQAGFGELLGVIEAALRYRLGRVDFEQLVVRAAGYLRGESIAELDNLGDRLFEQWVAARLYSHMHEIVQAHQARGHTSGAGPVARFLGITNVLGNHFELDNHGRITGGMVKTVVWGASKAAAVQQFCAANGIALQHSYFYADGDEDAASMSLVRYRDR